MYTGSAGRHTLRRVIVCLLGLCMLVPLVGGTGNSPAPGCAPSIDQVTFNLGTIVDDPQVLDDQIAASSECVEVTDFQNRLCSDAPVPVANDHTTINVITALRIVFDPLQAAALFNGPFALFPLGDGPNGLTIGPEGSTTMPPGEYVVTANFTQGLIPKADQGQFLQYGFNFDANGDPSDNFVAAPALACDPTNGTDLWVDNFYNPAVGWTVTVFDARNNEITPLTVDVRTIIEDNAIFSIIPVDLFAVRNPSFRMAIAGSPVTNFLDVIGSTFPPVGQPLQAFPEPMPTEDSPAGDLDGDGDVDLADTLSGIDCFSGPGVLVAPRCNAADLDGDGDVDLSDYVTHMTLLTGSRSEPPPPTETASYTVTFDGIWSADTHPTNFPGNAHFSGLIGAVHDESIDIWQPGLLASPGIKNMAETGSKSPLREEIEAAFQAAINRDSVGQVISGGGIGRSPGSVQVSFDASQTHPSLTLVSMIAPSPDWFVGVSGLPLFENGDWVDELVVKLAPYDAGTDSGSTFTSSNLPTLPSPEPIALITAPPLQIDGTVPSLGTFTIRRTD